MLLYQSCYFQDILNFEYFILKYYWIDGMMTKLNVRYNLIKIEPRMNRMKVKMKLKTKITGEDEGCQQNQNHQDHGGHGTDSL